MTKKRLPLAVFFSNTYIHVQKHMIELKMNKSFLSNSRSSILDAWFMTPALMYVCTYVCMHVYMYVQWRAVISALMNRQR
jgi:hypothetical protein